MANIELGGVASAFIDGATVEVAAAIQVKMGGIVYKPKVSSNGVAGFTSAWEAPEVTLEGIDGPAVSVQALKSTINGLLQVQLNNGKAYLLVGATCVADPEIDVADAKIGSLKFSGLQCNEVLAS